MRWLVRHWVDDLEHHPVAAAFALSLAIVLEVLLTR